MSGRRGTRRALVEEADAPELWTRRQTRWDVDDKEADAPGWRRMLLAVDKEADGSRTRQAEGGRAGAVDKESDVLGP